MWDRDHLGIAVRLDLQFLKIIWFIFAAIVLATCAQHALAIDKLSSELARIVSSSKVRGVSLALVKPIVQDDSSEQLEVKTLTIGDGAITTFSPTGDAGGVIAYQQLTSTTTLPTGSISKLITSLLILRAVQANVIALNDPVDRYLPGAIESRWRTPVTVAMLLEHTAGLSGSSYRDYAANVRGMQPLDYVRGQQPFVLRWQPGKHFSYANDGVTIAAAMLEEAWEADFDTLVQREIFTPLEMRSSHFSSEEVFARKQPRSLGFDGDGRVLLPVWNMPIRPSGALNSTPRDLAQVISMLLRRGKLSDDSMFLQPSLIRRMERAETSMAARHGVGHTSYGLGNFLYVAAGKVFHGHWGKTEGFSATLGYQPDALEGYVMIVNTADWATVHRLRETIAAAVGTEKFETISPQVNKDVSLRPAFLEEKLAKIPAGGATFVGYTHDHVQRAWLIGLLMACKIVPSADDLIMTSLLPFVLEQVYISEGTVYRERKIPAATAVLVEDREALWWIDGESYRREPAWEVWLKLIALIAGPLVACIAVVVGLAHFTSRQLRTLGAEKKHRETSVNSLDQSGRFTGGYLLGISGLSLVGFWCLFLTQGLMGGPGSAATFGQVGVMSVLITVLSVLSPALLIFAIGRRLRYSKSRKGMAHDRIFGSFFGGAAAIMGAHFFLLAANRWIPLITV